MNNKLVECVPNFSEGRDKAKVETIVAAARGVAGVRVLDVETDADHHRSVLSFVAPPDAALEAAFRVAARAKDTIDLTRHKGEHPRMGAVDVIPFIPVAGATIEECVSLAKRLGERIGRELEIPVYLYDRAALRPERKDLAQVRKGQFEGLREEIGANPERDPDFGPRRIHPTAGAVAVGAREQIINFNVNLSGLAMEDAKAIAKKIRTSGGGLPCLRAKEIDLAAKGQVQISTVLTDYSVTGIAKVYDAVNTEATALGAAIVATEIVGLVPRKALLDFALERLQVTGFSHDQILENRLDGIDAGWEAAAGRLVEAFASTDPTPGGGCAAGVAGAIGCALAQMAAGISAHSKKAPPEAKTALAKARGEFACMTAGFELLTAKDAAAFEAVMEALKLPKDDPQRPARLDSALVCAAGVPLETARMAAKAVAAAREAAKIMIGTVGSDIACASHLARAAGLCALENVFINVASIKDRAAAQRLEKEAEAIRQEIAP